MHWGDLPYGACDTAYHCLYIFIISDIPVHLGVSLNHAREARGSWGSRRSTGVPARRLGISQVGWGSRIEPVNPVRRHVILSAKWGSRRPNMISFVPKYQRYAISKSDGMH